MRGRAVIATEGFSSSPLPRNDTSAARGNRDGVRGGWHPADKQQPRNIAVWISSVAQREVCVLLARREEKHVAVFFSLLESGFIASLTTANISQAPAHKADIK